MNILSIFLNSFLVALLLLIFPVHALAIGEGPGAHHYQVANQRGAISQRKAIAIAQSYIQGRVLDIRQHNGIYRVKILSERGSIHIVQVNASDGEIITGH
ncbi:MAG: PepSY domain-containing protein [Nitrosomonas sp.]|nr:PepSY domain-containing protein [Nitrosomonas sp.]